MSEEAYPRTPVGEFELKSIPPGLACETRAARDAFDERGEMFSRNFRFLKENHIEMTTPVEMGVERRAMRFFVPRDAKAEALREVEGVELRRLEERLVASLGVRGGYSRARFETAEERLRAWIASRRDLEPLGPAEVAYWHGPMVPPFLRRFEVHVPVRRAG